MTGSAVRNIPFANQSQATNTILYKVSTVVSTYNSERFLRFCLQDLTEQTLFKSGGMEIIVINSDSGQGEEAVVLEFQKLHPNISYLRTCHESIYASWNRGLQMARGKYFINANTDDARRHDAFELLYEALEAHPEADLAYADCAWTKIPNDRFDSGTTKRRIIYPPYLPALTLFYCLTACTQFWRISALKKLGGFDTALQCVGDYEIMFRFANAGLQAVHVPEVLSLYYQNPDGLTMKSSMSREEEIAVREKYRGQIEITRFYHADPADPLSLANAWMTLGNLATEFRVPWNSDPIHDTCFAVHCFKKAAKADPRNPDALHNLAIELNFHNETHHEERVKSLPGTTGSFLSTLSCAIQSLKIERERRIKRRKVISLIKKQKLPEKHVNPLRSMVNRKEFTYVKRSVSSAVESIIHLPGRC